MKTLFIAEATSKGGRSRTILAAYELPSIDRELPPVTRHDKSFRVQFEALIKAFK